MSNLSFNSRTQRVTADAAPMLDSFLQSKPAKTQPEKTELTLRELISSVYNSIMQMKEKGYSSAEICEIIFEKTQMVIAPATLNTYIRQESKKRKNKRSKQKSKRLAIEYSSELGDRNYDVDSSQLEAEMQSETVELSIQTDVPDLAEDKREETASNEGADSMTRSKSSALSADKKKKFNTLILDRSKL